MPASLAWPDPFSCRALIIDHRDDMRLCEKGSDHARLVYSTVIMQQEKCRTNMMVIQW